MATIATDTTEIGLVLQGGGALGAYEYGAITSLLELIDAAVAKGHNVTLKAVTGVSIGAINAACVVGSANRLDARRRLAALWNDFASVDAFLLARADRARPVALRSAALLCHAARPLGAVELDLCLRYPSSAQDA